MPVGIDGNGIITGVSDFSSSNVSLTDPEITGGIYLGGTGSANYLDDYEEGTFTATVNGQSSSETGYYRKVGNLVTCALNAFVCDTDTTSTSVIAFAGFPFASNSTNNSLGTVSVWNHDNTSGVDADPLADSAGIVLTYGSSRSDSVFIRPAVTPSGNTSTNPRYTQALLKVGTRLSFTVSYFTD